MFGNRGNMGNMQGMMKKMQKMQAELAKTQEEIKQKTIEAVAGGGAVKVVINGSKELVSIAIEPTIAEDMEMLQDLILVAVNNGMKQVDKLTEEEMGKVTQGLNLPSGMF